MALALSRIFTEEIDKEDDDLEPTEEELTDIECDDLLSEWNKVECSNCGHKIDLRNAKYLDDSVECPICGTIN